MNQETLLAIESSVKKGINGQLVGIHQEIVDNQKAQVLAHTELRNQIKNLSDKIQPWDTGRNWIKQLMRGIIYLGAPAGGAFAIYKFVKIFIR